MTKTNKLFLITLILIPIFVVSIIYKISINEVVELKVPKKIKIIKDNKELDIELEEYIIGVVAGEMPASFEMEALKAQAVASRTYAIYKQEQNKTLTTTTGDQVYITIEEMKDKWLNEYDYYYNKIKTAVNETENIIMTKNNKVFKSYYFAMSNGETADSKTVFKESTIKSVSSPWDNETLNKFIVTTTFTKEEIKNKLNIPDITTLEILNRDSTNRVEEIKVNDKKLSGIEFRNLLKLRSTDFSIEIKDNIYSITTKGYGHGVGMSQYGANGMAKEKYTFKEILKHYYQDIEFKEL